MKGLSLVALNIRSLYPKIDELYIRFSEFDLICLSETWTNSNYTNEMLEFSGFDLFRQDRTSSNETLCKKRGGGLAIYVKKGLSEYVTLYSDECTVTPDLEKLFIVIDKPNVRKGLYGVVYRPPGGKIVEGVKELSDSVSKIQLSLNSEITIVGDFNINYNLRHSNAFKIIKEFEREFNLSQVIKTSTRVTRTTSNCIDLIFTNMEYIQNSGTLDVSISDHLPTFIIKKKSKYQATNTIFQGRSYSKYNVEQFQHDIRNHELWESYWDRNNESPEKLWDIMLQVLHAVADVHCPLKQMKFRDDSPEWITRDMVYEISHKDYLYKLAKRTDAIIDWENFHRKKNEVKNLLRNAKEDFIKGKLEEYGNNPRKFWRMINEMSGIGKNKAKSNSCSKIIDEDGVIYENLEAAQFLNSYYVNVGPNLSKKQDVPWDKTKCTINVESTFSFVWVRESDVLNMIKDIKLSKSSAVEGLSTRILKDAFLVLSLELTYLYNICLQKGIFPEAWCMSMVTPIPKTNVKSTKPGDWRPISQISLPGKLLERIIHNQLYNYVQLNNILSPNQFGFRKGLSTSLAIFEVLKELYANWNEKVFSGCMFIDFSRAFDSINHKILFQKLELYGLDEISLSFFKSYMGNRTQCTTVNGHTSDREKVTCGTAQGSILGPLLFIIYINDLFTSIETDGNIYMYADDTLIVCKSNNLEIVAEKIQKALTQMCNWCTANKLSINFSKTKYMTIKHTQTNIEPPVRVNNINIGTVNTYEYLGMILDTKLSMNEYVDSMWKKTNSKVGILSKIRRFITEKTAVNIYKCMIRPHLDYIDFVVDSSASDRILKLDRLQNKALRRIEYCTDANRRESIDVLQGKYNIEPLKLRRKRNLVKIIYKNSKNTMNIDQERPNMDLRSKPKVKLKSKFTSITKVYNSPLYRGLRLWDKLTPNLQKEENKFRFKSEINKFDWT